MYSSCLKTHKKRHWGIIKLSIFQCNSKFQESNVPVLVFRSFATHHSLNWTQSYTSLPLNTNISKHGTSGVWFSRSTTSKQETVEKRWKPQTLTAFNFSFCKSADKFYLTGRVLSKFCEDKTFPGCGVEPRLQDRAIDHRQGGISALSLPSHIRWTKGQKSCSSPWVWTWSWRCWKKNQSRWKGVDVRWGAQWLDIWKLNASLKVKAYFRLFPLIFL